MYKFYVYIWLTFSDDSITSQLHEMGSCQVVIVVTPELQIGSIVQNVMIGCTAFVLKCHAIKQRIKILFLFVVYVKVVNKLIK